MYIKSEEMTEMLKVFISSTFYDLKYAREYISDFIVEYGFTPIRSEAGDIGYTPGEELDTSCYEAMREADMVVLIIGGRYGSPASESNEDLNDDDKFVNYLSVTRKEFLTADHENIPIFVYVDQAVETEYRFYKKNKTKIENDIKNKTLELDFSSVDNINVFRFIDEVFDKSSIPVTAFSSISEVKINLKKQWVALFNKYLRERRTHKAMRSYSSTIDELYTRIKEMSITVEEISGKIIGEKTSEILESQMIERYASLIANNFEFISIKKKSEEIKEFLEVFVENLFRDLDNDSTILRMYFSPDPNDISIFDQYYCQDGFIITKVEDCLTKESFEDIASIDNYKTKIVQRLLQRDYLKKVNLLYNK